MMSQKPEFISFNDTKRIEKLKNDSVVFVDRLGIQIEELCEIRHPQLRDDKDNLNKKKKEYSQEFKAKGQYCHLPWKKICTAVLSEDLFFEVRTARNKDLITKEDQNNFRQTTVAIAGLSVGSNIARLCVLQGGSKKINLADPDTIGLSNLNRILAGVDDLGRKKTEVLAEKLYEIDPFLEITQFDEGANDIDKFIHNENKLVDVIAEEVDHLPTKIALREAASANKIPLFSITDNGDGIIADVERYDQDFDISDFYKRLDKVPKDKKDLKIQEVLKMVTNFIGVDDIDTSMLDSSTKVGTELYSWPQLGGAAVLSGVVGAYIIRQIVNKKELKSGRYVISLPDVFSLHDKNDKKLRKKLLKYYKY